MDYEVEEKTRRSVNDCEMFGWILFWLGFFVQLSAIGVFFVEISLPLKIALVIQAFISGAVLMALGAALNGLSVLLRLFSAKK